MHWAGHRFAPDSQHVDRGHSYDSHDEQNYDDQRVLAESGSCGGSVPCLLQEIGGCGKVVGIWLECGVVPLRQFDSRPVVSYDGCGFRAHTTRVPALSEYVTWRSSMAY